MLEHVHRVVILFVLHYRHTLAIYYHRIYGCFDYSQHPSVTTRLQISHAGEKCLRTVEQEEDGEEESFRHNIIHVSLSISIHFI